MVRVLHLVEAVVEDQRRLVLVDRLGGHAATLKRCDRGERLHHRPRLVHVRDHWILETARVTRSGRSEIICIVGRPRRRREDASSEWVHHHDAHRFGAIGDTSGCNLLLNKRLQRGIDAESEVSTRVSTRELDHPINAVAPPLGSGDASVAGQLLLVVGLKAVLTNAVSVHEADDVACQRGSRSAADLLVVTHTNLAEGDELRAGEGSGDRAALLVVEPGEEGDPGAPRGERRVNACRLSAPQRERSGECPLCGGALFVVHLCRLGVDVVAHHRLGENDRPGAIRDRAAIRSLLVGA